MAADTRARNADEDRYAGAMRIVHRYVMISAGAGLITIPVIDVATLAGVHVALIKDITEHYGEEFSDHAARNIVIALAASLVPGAIGSMLGRKALRMLAVITGGSGLAGLAIMSAFSAMVSLALGTVFVRHFEEGGTLDSFNLKSLHRLFNHKPVTS